MLPSRLSVAVHRRALLLPGVPARAQHGGCSAIVVDGRGSICKLPIGRVVGPADIAALAVHMMSNTAPTGATFDIDGGQQFVR